MFAMKQTVLSELFGDNNDEPSLLCYDTEQFKNVIAETRGQLPFPIDVCVINSAKRYFDILESENPGFTNITFVFGVQRTSKGDEPMAAALWIPPTMTADDVQAVAAGLRNLDTTTKVPEPISVPEPTCDCINCNPPMDARANDAVTFPDAVKVYATAEEVVNATIALSSSMSKESVDIAVDLFTELRKDFSTNVMPTITTAEIRQIAALVGVLVAEQTLSNTEYDRIPSVVQAQRK